jgi:hypothetical protein
VSEKVYEGRKESASNMVKAVLYEPALPEKASERTLGSQTDQIDPGPIRGGQSQTDRVDKS